MSTPTSVPNAKEIRATFGEAGGPIPATRVFVKPMSHDFGVQSDSILIINDNAGTVTAANVYGGKLGKGYKPSKYTNPLPAAGDQKWKDWAKRGYIEGSLSDPRFSALLETTKVKTKAKTPATTTASV